MKIPPTPRPVYKEKSRNNLAHVLVQQTKGKEALGWNSGVPDSSLDTATESPFLSREMTSRFRACLSLSANERTPRSLPALTFYNPTVLPLDDRICSPIRVSLSALSARKLRVEICAQ